MALLLAAVLLAVAAAFWGLYHVGYRAGYRDGILDREPQHRAVVVVRRNTNVPYEDGASYTWFDVSKPEDAARLRQEEAKLQARHVEYYVTKGRIQTHLEPEPDPRHVDSHR